LNNSRFIEFINPGYNPMHLASKTRIMKSEKAQNTSENKGKKSFVLRIDESTYKLLEKWANDEFRSVNGQIEYLLHQSLVNSGRKKKE